MKLRLRFLLLTTAIFIVFVFITYLLSLQLINKINQEWGRQFTVRQVLFDKYRTLSPLIREITLARKMAADPEIIRMAMHENDPELVRRGIAAMENYRYNFRDHSYFAALARSGNYYFNDAANQYKSSQLRYVLSPKNANDKWFYATLSDGKEYQVNLDPDTHLGVTKVWINVLIKNGGDVLGVIGTGIDLTDFLKETVSISQQEVHNLFIDSSLAIQLNSDPGLIDYMSIAKEVSQRSKVDLLLKNPSDVEHLRLAMQRLQATPEHIETLWVDYQEGKHLLGVAYLPEIGWYDLTLMDAQSLALIEGKLLAPILFGIAFLIALITMGLALRNWVLKPIATLQQSTEKIKHGNFNVDLSILGHSEIGNLSRSFVSMAEHVRDTNLDLENKIRERTEELQRLTEIDPLTGLLNRRGMTQRFEQDIAWQARQGGSLGLLLLDLDHFKKINDVYGHVAGDLALCEVAKVLQVSKRTYDHASRWGGEEFLILLPDCDKRNLRMIAERIREGICALRLQAAGHELSFTVSIGAHHSTAPQTLDAMLQKVDDALYAAKDGGRDCIRFSADESDIQTGGARDERVGQ